MTSSSPNLWKRSFWSLMATQCQNAFSDNALKNLVILLVLAQPMPESERHTQVALTGALFAAPFILFSMLGGWLADRFSKQKVMAAVKISEVAIMLYAGVALHLRNVPMQLSAIFLMGCHSAIFGPSKYGILPEILPSEKLSWGNGILELLTFVGIIGGTVAGSFFAGAFTASPGIPGLLLAILAVAGWQCSRTIGKTAAASPNAPPRINPLKDLVTQMRHMAGDRDLWRANWGNTGFYFIATLVQMNLILHAKDVLLLSETQNGLLNAALAIGIGVGSVIAGYASRGRIEYRLVPLGATLMAVATIPMGLSWISTSLFCFALICLGLGAGLFIVPIAAVLQHRPSADSKGAVQGAASVLSFTGILAASGAQVLLSNSLGLTSGTVFWFCGCAALITGVYVAYSRRLFSAPIPVSPE